jgi:hypothetical protein
LLTSPDFGAAALICEHARAGTGARTQHRAMIL